MSHGVEVSEIPTAALPPVRVLAGLPVYVGTAPINLGQMSAVNRPILAYTLAEYVAAFGPVLSSSQWDAYTLCEAAKAHFQLYGVGPIVLVNVLDPDNSDHVGSATGEAHTLDSDGNATIGIYGAGAQFGVIKSTVIVKVGMTTKTLGTDYTLAYDDDGYLVVSRVSTGSILAGATLAIDFDYLDPSGVTSDDIIGGYSAGKYTGLECVKQVFPRLKLVPGLILAPGWSHEPTVAARMKALAASVDGFRALAVADLSTDPYEIATHEDAAAWKADNGYTGANIQPCWPRPKLGADVYRASTHFACITNLVDSAQRGIPYASPSNKALQATAAVDDDGTEILLTKAQANALNDAGIVTLLSFGRWLLWGNRTGAYPLSTDPRDSLIALRRMFNWFGNTVLLTAAQVIDEPTNRRLIDSVIGTIGQFINGLIAQGALLDGSKIEFRSDENPTTDLADGKVRFHVTLCPPSPAEVIEFITEYDSSLNAALFA